MTIERNAYYCNKKSIFRFLAVLKYDKDCNKKSIFRFLAVLKYDKDYNMIVIKNQALGSLHLQNIMKILTEKMFSWKKSVYMELTP